MIGKKYSLDKKIGIWSGQENQYLTLNIYGHFLANSTLSLTLYSQFYSAMHKIYDQDNVKNGIKHSFCHLINHLKFKLVPARLGKSPPPPF